MEKIISKRGQEDSLFNFKAVLGAFGEGLVFIKYFRKTLKKARGFLGHLIEYNIPYTQSSFLCQGLSSSSLLIFLSLAYNGNIMELLPFLDDYLLFLKTNKYSSETVYNYERDLTTFTTFLSSSPDLNRFDKISKKTIDQYKAYLVSRDRQTPIKNEKGAELSPQSINRMLSAVRSYLKYLVDRDEQVPIPPEAIKLVKTEKKHPRVAELEELIRLIESPQSLEKNLLIGLRNRAIFEVLFSTGMRISELVSLNKVDIDKTGRIFILGKGKKERFVYLTPRSFNILDRYLVTRKDSFEALFIPYSGLNVNKKEKRLSPNYIQAKIKRYRERLKINIPISAHSLRHGFATYLAESGASPAAIQILLGHESLDTTTRYVHASDRFAEETHRKFHPLKERKNP